MEAGAARAACSIASSLLAGSADSMARATSGRMTRRQDGNESLRRPALTV